MHSRIERFAGEVRDLRFDHINPAAEKLLLLTPKTLKTLRKMGITTVSYMIDNAFGPRRRGVE